MTTKKLLTIFCMSFGLLLVTGKSAHAFSLYCMSENNDRGGFANNAVGPLNYVEADCVDLKGNHYEFRMMGRFTGLGIDFGFYEAMTIQCPLVRGKIVREKGLVLYGPQVSAGIFVGGRAGMGVGERGSVCVLGGAAFRFGASVFVNALEIQPAGERFRRISESMNSDW